MFHKRVQPWLGLLCNFLYYNTYNYLIHQRNIHWTPLICKIHKQEKFEHFRYSTINNSGINAKFEQRANVYTSQQEELLMNPTSKIAIITGASTSIGYAVARELVSAGVTRVVLCDSNYNEGRCVVQKLCSEFGSGAALFFSGDASDPKTYVHLFEETIARFQKVDILFNNTDIFHDGSWIQEVKSVVRGTLLAQRYMNKKRNKDLRGSVVINSANVFALDTIPEMPAFCSPMHAVIGFSRSLGDTLHYNCAGVRVIALCPGLTKGHEFYASLTQQLQNHWHSELKRLCSTLPVQDAAAVGQAVVHLVRYAPSGSVWVVENSQLLQAEIPDYTAFKIDDTTESTTTGTPVRIQKTRRNPSSYTRLSKLHVYRVKGEKNQ
ncbi:15-hydroxyprostaglandin dehydrogenase [NAD(+)]-like [Periplaneta americana]|uniref:15-hydroxyprostaglandin dehydrogenase [NAD(+)]-like n=1 Tax=Periplaneta americana TaxID=6978 RepID=UPI0037E8B1AA